MSSPQPPNVAGARTASERVRLYLETGKVQLAVMNSKNNRLIESDGWQPADDRWRLYCRWLQDHFLEVHGQLSSAAGALEQAIRTEQEQAQIIANLIGLLTLARTAPRKDDTL